MFKCSKFLLSNSMDKTARIWDIKPFVSGDRNIKTFQGATVRHHRARCSYSLSHLLLLMAYGNAGQPLPDDNLPPSQTLLPV